MSLRRQTWKSSDVEKGKGIQEKTRRLFPETWTVSVGSEQKTAESWERINVAEENGDRLESI